MVKLWEYASLTAEERTRLMRRAEQDISDLLPLAQEVVSNVRQRGDAAVVEYARKFDAKDFSADMLRVKPEQFAEAWKRVPSDVIDALKLAYENIKTFYEE